MPTRANHPSGLTVEFQEADHIYKVIETGEVLQSATTFIGNFFPEFDTETVAAKCVGKPKYKGMSAEEIKEAWAKEAHRGRTEGTHAHFYAECLFEGNFDQLPTPKSKREENLFEQVTLAVSKLEDRFVYIGSEIIVFSPAKQLNEAFNYVGYGKAGMMDLLMFDPVEEELLILEWKQNKKIDDNNPWEKANPPLQRMDACDLNKYRLQLNFYEFILHHEQYLGFEKIPPARGVRKALVHLREDGFRPIKIENYQKEIWSIVDKTRF